MNVSLRYIGVVAAVVCMAASAAGCASDTLLEAGQLSAENNASNASAFGPSAAASQDAGGFNPFADMSTTTSSGGREVIQNPSIGEVMKTGDLPEMSWGKANAPVTVVKYASLTCPICRKFHREVLPKLKRNYIDTGKIRFILREFPIGRSSGNATIALRCAPPSQYLTLYGKFLNQQAKWVSQEVRIEKIHGVAKQVGLSRARLDACLKDEKLIADLKWIKKRGRTLGIIGTPNFFIQGELVKKALGYEDMAARIDAILSGRVAAAGTQGG